MVRLQWCRRSDGLTFVEVAFVEDVWSGNIHIIQTGNLKLVSFVSGWADQDSAHFGDLETVSQTAQWPERGNGEDTSEVLQQLDLSQGALGQDLLAEDICNLFDGNAFSRLVVCGSAKIAISGRIRERLDCLREFKGGRTRPGKVEGEAMRTTRCRMHPDRAPW